MKRFLPAVILLLGLAYVGWTLLPPRNPGAFDLVGFGRLPVLADGRMKPLDTLARSSLLIIHGNQFLATPDGNHPLLSDDGHELTPTDWLLDVFFRPEKADGYAIFTVDNPDLLALIGRNDDNLAIKYSGAADQVMATIGMLDTRYRQFSFREISPYLDAIGSQARLAEPVDEAARTPFQRGVVQLADNLALYDRLKHAVVSPDSADFLGDLLTFQGRLPDGVAAVRAKQAGQPHDEAAVQALLAIGQRFAALAASTNILPIPPDSGSPDPNAWRTTGQALLETFQTGEVNSAALAYAGLGYAWRQQRPEQFNHLVNLFGAELDKRLGKKAIGKVHAEERFNAVDPFNSSMVLYVLAFLLAVVSWLRWPETLGKCAFLLVALAWISATAGILVRMWLEGRPPVTNLYSSALFIGWGAVALCLVLEVIYRNAIGSVAAGLIGFSTLIIAHHLALGGDTMEMMRAVLDSNFWLGTHVVVVTTGYASTFLAGCLALIYVLRGVFTKSLDRGTADALARMVYGIVCFATLFSFVGTVLGGIWADQSWGRFWGWDPKENGAVMIVLWNALILHARWGGMVRQRGLMCLAIFGNIVTSWSWFGTNMLGVGLHSYGFTEAAFWWLTAFVASQLCIIAIANLPLAKWRSFAAGAPHS
jgi:ABC-type transport system involved in cytochrome c biogenesis permease subunit